MRNTTKKTATALTDYWDKVLTPPQKTEIIKNINTELLSSEDKRIPLTPEETGAINAELISKGIQLTPIKNISRIDFGEAHYHSEKETIPAVEAIIQGNDRLREYQILKRNIDLRFNKCWCDVDAIWDEDLLKDNAHKMRLVRGMWLSAYKPSFDSAKIWNIEEEQVPIIFHTDSKFDVHLPFPSIILNATIPIKQRIYYGIFVGSFYTEDYHYRLLFTTFSEVCKSKISKKDKKEGKKEIEKTIWGVDIFPIDSIAFEDFSINNLTYYQKKLTNFVFSFCNYTYHPEVTTIEMPYNPNNNKRRIARGITPLPAYRKIIVKGNLQIYIDRIAKKISRIRQSGLREYWIRGTYYHFKNKLRFRRIYALPQNLLDKKDYIIRDGFICKFIKPKCMNRGSAKIIQEWEIK